ncbi:BQ5605_C001g00381 [Microbotryum silenes-dioicae]|uniref:BQ5605_C001g00381 protein n=1 Tax=Microbotryum silenes-dioicae TaxID=796604 RepID=A0A2X0P011_9BASI|nr:BQ5605_C001g00381 [Microbotryum silenes-dioicae]
MAPKKGQKGSSKQPSRVASGASTPAPRAEPVKAAPAVVGINFGQSFSSIAVINKEAIADCIANDDGERQIASALSFNETEEYSGVPARIQLVRNAPNTILGFRNLLGKTYDEVKDTKQPYNSAKIVDSNGQPAFTVSINDTPTTLTAHECCVRFLKVLLSYASDFLGRPVTSAVVAVPTDFTPAQTKALVQAAEEAKITVVQTLDSAAAALVAYHATELKETDKVPPVDRNSVVLDVGATSTTVSVVAVRQGLFVPLSSHTEAKLGGDLFDDKLIEWFSKEFTKKTKTPIEASNHRALMKLRLAVEVTKKSLSASNSAPCSVESLAEGLDFHGSINRMRFDLLSASVYSRVNDAVAKALESAKLNTLEIDEVILVGGSTRLPSLLDKLYNLFTQETLLISSQLDPDEVVAKGAALQGQALLDSTVAQALTRALNESTIVEPTLLTKPIGLVVDDAFHVLVKAKTPLPLRRTFELPVAKSTSSVLVSLWEGEQKVVTVAPTPKPAKKASGGGWFGSKKAADEDEDEDDDDEDEDKSELVAEKTSALADVTVDTENGKKVKVVVEVFVGGKGKLTVKGKGDKVVKDF